jgi:hypothetical protein
MARVLEHATTTPPDPPERKEAKIMSDSHRLRLASLGARVFAVAVAMTVAVTIASTSSFAAGGKGYGYGPKAGPDVTLVPVVKEVPVTRMVLVPVKVSVVKLVPVIHQITVLRKAEVGARIHACPLNANFETNHSDDIHERRCQKRHGAMPYVGWWKTPDNAHVTTKAVTRTVVTFRQVVVFKTAWVWRLITITQPVIVLKPVFVTKQIPGWKSCC